MKCPKTDLNWQLNEEGGQIPSGLLAVIKKQELKDMTPPKKLIRREESLLDLAEYLQNISQVCKIHGVSRQHFYDIRKVHEEHGLEGLREKSRRNPVLRTG